MSFLTDALERMRTLLFRSREERELAEELRFHLEEEAAHRRRAGLEETEAERQSRLALGGVERTKEAVRDARGTRWIEDTRGDIAFTLRTLAHHKGFAAVVILTLALGIGGTTAIFSAVNAVLLQPLPYAEPGQLVRLYGAPVGEPDARWFLSPVQFGVYRDRLETVESLAAVLTYSERGADVGSGADAHRIRLLYTSANYFDVLRVAPVLGRALPREAERGPGIGDEVEAADLVVLSHQLWQDQFHGDPAAIGSRFLMNGKSYEVVGVMPAGFKDPIADGVAAWVALDLSFASDPAQAGNHYISVIGRLRPDVTVAGAQAEVDRVALQIAADFPDIERERARLYPLKEDVVGSSSRALGLMLGAVGLVLLLVCVNLANLMLVRGSERSREFAVRSALGAGGRRLARQLLIESLTLALAGALTGLVVARLAMSAIVSLADGNIPRLEALSLDPWLLLLSLALGTGCAVLFGLAPALRAARTQPGDVLQDQSRSNSGSARSLRSREWLVISQVALAFVLLIGAGLLLASFRLIGRVDLGIASDNVLTFQLNLPDARYDSTARAVFFDNFASQVAALPGVRAAGGVSRLPATGAYHHWGTQALSGPLVGDDERSGAGAQNRVVSGDYFKALGIPVIAGRAFTAGDDRAAPDRVVISRQLADRLYPGIEAVGQRLLSGGRESEVIGVVGDVAVTNEGEADNFVYHPHRQFAGDRNWALTQVIATDGPPTALAPAVRRLLVAADPQLVMFRPTPLDEVIGRGAAQRLFTMRILLTFAAVALALAALGLFGVLAYGVRLRTREFGIRMALGAEKGEIQRVVLRQGLTVAALGVALGLVVALPLSRVMWALLFQVSPLDPWVIAGAILFTGIVAGVASYLPARQATAVDPRTALQ